jgi:outer membrane receptor protein involved in Fe transport
VQSEWTPAPDWRFEAGLRWNATDETIEGEAEPIGEEEPGEDEEGAGDDRNESRLSGAIGLSWRAYRNERGDEVWLHADGRDTFKPAVVDFGPEAEGEILAPEEARSFEVGAKGRHLAGRWSWEVSAFRMDFSNLVTSAVVNGRPALINSGEERFEGIELELGGRLTDDLHARLTYARHNAEFREFSQLFDGVPTQLRGRQLEMSARDLAAAALFWRPTIGLGAWAGWNWIGERFLNKRNTALAPGFSLLDAGLSYRFAGGQEVRIDGRNLTDERDPVAESELGDAQYYRQPARTWIVSWLSTF